MRQRTLIALLLGLPISVWAQSSGGPYVQPRSVIAAGGGVSNGGTYHLNGSIGQHEAEALHPASGGSYQLVSGYWTSATSPADTLFANGFESP